jgi:hypothetical protein
VRMATTVRYEGGQELLEEHVQLTKLTVGG